MKVSLDTNIWIFGILGIDKNCERILLNLEKFEVVIPDQIREELERNLHSRDMRQFYQIALRSGIPIDFGRIDSQRVTLRHFSNYPPPNRACQFPSTRLSSKLNELVRHRICHV